MPFESSKDLCFLCGHSSQRHWRRLFDMFEGERQPFRRAAENPGRLASSPFPSFLPSRRDLWDARPTGSVRRGRSNEICQCPLFIRGADLSSALTRRCPRRHLSLRLRFDGRLGVGVGEGEAIAQFALKKVTLFSSPLIL